MSQRAKEARRLATALAAAAGDLHVRVQYDRAGGRYAVHWTGGPTSAEMQDLAARHAESLPLLNLAELVFLRTELS